MKLGTAFSLDAPDNINNISFQAADLATPMSAEQVRAYFQTAFDWGRQGASGIPADGLSLPDKSDADRRARTIILAIVLPLGVAGLALAALAAHMRATTPQPLREILLKDLTFEGVSAWLPAYALAEGTFRGFHVLVQVHVKKGFFKTRTRTRKDKISVLSVVDKSGSGAGQSASSGRTTMGHTTNDGTSAQTTPSSIISARSPAPRLKSGRRPASSLYALPEDEATEAEAENAADLLPSASVAITIEDATPSALSGGHDSKESGPEWDARFPSGSDTKLPSDGSGSGSSPSYSMVLLQLKSLVVGKQAQARTLASRQGAVIQSQTVRSDARPGALSCSVSCEPMDDIFGWDDEPPACDGIDGHDAIPITIDMPPGAMPMGAASGLRMLVPRAHHVVLPPPSPVPSSQGGASSGGGSDRGRLIDSPLQTHYSGTSDLMESARALFLEHGVRHFLLSPPDPEQWLALLGSLRSSQVVLAIGCCRTHHEVLVLREEMPSGSLSDVLSLRAACPLDHEGKMRALVDVARGLSYLKSLTDAGARGRTAAGLRRLLRPFLSSDGGAPAPTLVHGRAMPSNIFLDAKMNAKLGIDLALPFLPTRELVVYSAPEVLRGEPPSPSSDVYQFGILLLEVLGGVPAFEGIADEDVIEGVKSGRLRPTLPATGLPIAIGDVILFCTAVKPSHRPNIETLVQELERYSFYVELDEHEAARRPSSRGPESAMTHFI